MRFTSNEKKLLIGACVAACLLGAYAGYIAYTFEQEDQLHGGILEEDAAEAFWHLRWVAARVFAQVGTIAFCCIGLVPLSMWRFLSRSGR